MDADFRFDFDQIAVPFRMRPGLARLPAGASQLTRLRPDSARADEKRRVLQAGASRHVVPGFDPADAIESIAAHAVKTWAEGQFDAQIPLELAFEEDFAVLDGQSGRLAWLCVCTPSHWAPEDKIGQMLDAVHRPVADSAVLTAATAHLVRLVTGRACWQRFVWTVSPSPCYDQHPRRHPRAAWPETTDPADFAAQCWLRAERQTFFPVGRGTQQAVFTIRVMLSSLPNAVDTAQKARRLHDSLASMSDAVLAYKGLSPAQARLLTWLQSRFAFSC